MQGLFRNPLADPALVGVSSGGAFAAAAAIVFTDSQIGESLRFMQNRVAADRGFRGLAGHDRRSSIASRAARAGPRSRSSCWRALRSPRIANAGIGLLVFIADDRQLRDITFWLLGSLSGATWSKLATLAPVLGARAGRLPVDRARARRAGARRGRGVPQRRRRRAAEADFDRAGVGDDRASRFRFAASSDLSASWCRICCGW